jgi:hypothetical protein
VDDPWQHIPAELPGRPRPVTPAEHASPSERRVGGQSRGAVIVWLVVLGVIAAALVAMLWYAHEAPQSPTG